MTTHGQSADTTHTSVVSREKTPCCRSNASARRRIRTLSCSYGISQSCPFTRCEPRGLQHAHITLCAGRRRYTALFARVAATRSVACSLFTTRRNRHARARTRARRCCHPAREPPRRAHVEADVLAAVRGVPVARRRRTVSSPAPVLVMSLFVAHRRSHLAVDVCPDSKRSVPDRILWWYTSARSGLLARCRTIRAGVALGGRHRRSARSPEPSKREQGISGPRLASLRCSWVRASVHVI